ncbi:helix-turn-helix domain-containing protein [Streptomyces similanensis]|uniref:Helix-turn-helix transcriptional regulator n=1 Tax=Streptomyces similanensis TaxID=1274988 RepID=A0ABP9K081_9ACTN
MTNQAPNQARVVPPRPSATRPGAVRPARETPPAEHLPTVRQGGFRPAAERPAAVRPVPGRPAGEPFGGGRPVSGGPAVGGAGGRGVREPLWRDLVGDVLRRERLAQERTLKDVADAARISMPYLSEVERGRKEASSEVLAAAAQALGLGLGDLLALAHGELVRITSRVADRGRGSAAARVDGLCLAA